MSLNILHPLPMLVHELVEKVLGRTTGREALFQSLERLVHLVELKAGTKNRRRVGRKHTYSMLEALYPH